MAYELHKSGVITGYVNNFCLACDSFLGTAQETQCHIKTSAHAKNLIAIPYSDKFKDQNIKKFKTGYFCEFCNELMSTTVTVGLHVNEERHKQNRGANLIQVLDNDVIAFKTVLIKERAWHGLIENVCAICDVEFEDENCHKMNTTHLLNSIRRPVIFGAGDAIYRQIDDSTCQCLTCNKLFPTNTMTKHFVDDNHVNLYAKSKIEAINDIKKNIKPDGNNNNNIRSNVNKNKQELKKPNVNDNDDIRANYVNKNKQDLKKPNVNDNNSINENDVNKQELKKPDMNYNNNIRANEVNENCPKRKDFAIKSQESLPDISGITNSNNKGNGNNNKISDENKLINSIATYQSNGIDINYEMETAFCRKCCLYINCDKDVIDIHIQKHLKIKTSFRSAIRYPTNIDKTKYQIKQQENETLDPEPQKQDPNYASSNHIVSELSKVVPEIQHIDESNDNGACNDSSPTCTSANLDSNDKERNTADAQRFAKDNHITFNMTNNSAFCRICEVKLPSTLKSMKEHVNGMPHKRKLAATAAEEAAKRKDVPTSQSMRAFIRSMELFMHSNLFGYLLNDKHFLGFFSFCLATKNRSTGRIMCFMCKVNYNLPFTALTAEKHMKQCSMKFDTHVITSEEFEFIRECRGNYHCGYCNHAEESWSDMERHLKTSEHGRRKSDQYLRSGVARGELPIFALRLCDYNNDF